jgi:fatty acid desaturase
MVLLHLPPPPKKKRKRNRSLKLKIISKLMLTGTWPLSQFSVNSSANALRLFHIVLLSLEDFILTFYLAFCHQCYHSLLKRRQWFGGARATTCGVPSGLCSGSLLRQLF